MYFVEGNIGCGKSSFLRELEKRGIPVLQEPVDAWSRVKNENGKNILEEFYANPKRHAYLFQSIAFRSRVNAMSQLTDPKTVVERSVFTDRNIFAETVRADGNMTNIEWDDYTKWFDWVIDKCPKPEKFVYLRADPETCLKRIKYRARSGESTISLEYLQKLHDRHDVWLMDEPNVLVIDANEPLENSIKKFLETY